jgi:hypothetical protein
MTKEYVKRLSNRRHPGAAPLSFANRTADPDRDWVGRFEIAKASPRSPHLTATKGAR